MIQSTNSWKDFAKWASDMKTPMVDWDLNPTEAEALQSRLCSKVIQEDCLGRVQSIAGIDVAYCQKSQAVYAGVVVLDSSNLNVIEQQTVSGESQFPYIPGLFAFREIPILLQAINKLQTVPDLIICDGQGMAHPRRFGLASHLGVLIDCPMIGCGKSRFIGDYEMPQQERGSFSPLVDHSEVIGSVLRTQDGVKPLFVSIGHRISLPTSRDWILKLANRYRQPEPIRRANELVNHFRAGQKQ